MARKKTAELNQSSSHEVRPALTPESREQQLIHLATNLAEQQLRDGTASSQVITHYLKLGTTKAKLELERERKEMELIEAKKQQIYDGKKMEEMYREAMEAMKRYSGNGGSDD